MNDNDIIQKAIEEIQSKTFGFTQQFLAVHEVDLVNAGGRRIDRESRDGTVIVYFPVKHQKFSFAVYLDTASSMDVSAVGTVPYASVYFRASTVTLDLLALAALTILPNSGGWSKGDKRGAGHARHEDSCIQFEPNPEPGDFEYKLGKLLTFLEQDKAGIKVLAEKAGGYIQVAMEFHNGNTMLGGPHISRDLIMRMSLLNLEIDFDLYVGGAFFET